MAAANSSSYKLLPSLWPQKSIYEILIEVSPTLGILKKDTSFYEKVRYIGVGVGTPQGTAPTFEQAKASKTASTAQEFAVTPVSYYGAFSVDGRLMRMAKGGNKAILVDPVKRESKNLIWQWKRDLSRYLFGNGGGSIGRITGTLTTVTALLSKASDRRAFQPNMLIQASSTDGTSGSLRSGEATVSSVGGTLDAPSVISTVAWATAITGCVTDDYLFRKGVFGNVVTGFDGWNPSHSGSPGALFGVTRTTNPYELAGIPVDGAALSHKQAIGRAARRVHEAGGKPDTYITSTANYESLSNELQSAGMLRYSQVPAQSIGKFHFGVKYDAIQVMGPAGPINVIADPDCPDAVSRMLTLDTWTLASTGELVSWIDGAGPGGLMMEDGADAGEGRLVGDYQLICEAPGWNARVAH